MAERRGLVRPPDGADRGEAVTRGLAAGRPAPLASVVRPVGDLGCPHRAGRVIRWMQCLAERARAAHRTSLGDRKVAM